VRPTNFPASKSMTLLAGLVSTMQFGLMFVLFADDSVLPVQMRENKGASFFAIFMGGSMVTSSMTKTSAFEIYIGKQLVFSSIQMQRMPNLKDLVSGFKKAGVKINSGGL